MNSPVLTIDRPDVATAILSLNRPERRNALSVELMQSLCEAMQSLALEPARRIVILRGEGPVFCAGLDLVEAADTQIAVQSARWVAQTFETLIRSPLVTIAAAHGAAYAGGAGLLACCDFAVAADDLRIGLPEVRRGLVPALAAVVLARRLRDRDLRELALLAEPMDAQRALGMGLIHRAVPAGRLLAEAREIAASLLAGAPEAVRHTKSWLDTIGQPDCSQLFARALELHTQARLSGEAGEGLAAFRQHRNPSWPATL